MFSFDQDSSETNFFIFLKYTQIDPKFNLNNLAGEGRLDLLCRVFANVFFLSNNFRENSNLFAFFQKESILVKFIGKKIKKVNPDERSVAGYLKKVFRIIMENSSLERDFLWEYISLEDIPLKIPHAYVLDRNGTNIRDIQFTKKNHVFFLGDHKGLTENEKSYLTCYQSMSLGKTELLASQCVTIIYHYINDVPI